MCVPLTMSLHLWAFESAVRGNNRTYLTGALEEERRGTQVAQHSAWHTARA